MKEPPKSTESLPPVTPARTGLRAELRSLLRPERRWHWVFHLIVALVASAYWLISLFVGRTGLRTLEETILYRPGGDGQLWPLIISLSHFNFGDPTDIIKYGTGTLSIPVIAVAPYALACAVFGPAGFIVADVLVALLYFFAVCLFLRVCGVGRFTSLVLGAGLATGGFQLLVKELADAFALSLDPLGVVVAENFFPNLLTLHIYGNRIHRPMITEIWVVLTMTGLLRLWLDASRSSFAFGVGMGVLLGVLVQGDLYSTAALGLLAVVVLVRVARTCGWQRPIILTAGAICGTAAVTWHFIHQRLTEHPDVPRRLGMTLYERSSLLFLPGYAPLLRLAVVAAMAGCVWLLVRHLRQAGTSDQATGPAPGPPPGLGSFFTLLLIAANLAQPIQILLLGRAAQIYHYLHIVPIFYSYAMLVLVFHLVRLASPPAVGQLLYGFAAAPGRAGAVFLAVTLGCGTLIAVGPSMKRIYEQSTVRNAADDYEPWGKFGNSYRNGLTRLDRGLIKSPLFPKVHSFATFNLDVYVLLGGLRGKRAFVPDASLTVLTDEEIEDRLCIMGKICDLSVNRFAELIQSEPIKNYFWGSNKYRFASDHRFSSNTNDYNPALFKSYIADRHFHQWGWVLAVPLNETKRVAMRYLELLQRPPNLALYPDLIIFDHNEVAAGWRPLTNYYALAATNEVFQLYAKHALTAPQ